MRKREELEKYFYTVSKNLSKYLPDGVLEINIRLLQDLGLLVTNEKNESENSLKSTFEVIETEDKMVLINKRFIIWIVSDRLTASGATYTLIALNQKPKPRPELCFLAKGVYNTTNVVIRVLEKLLTEITENEELVEAYEKAA